MTLSRTAPMMYPEFARQLGNIHAGVDLGTSVSNLFHRLRIGVGTVLDCGGPLAVEHHHQGE